MTKGYHSWFSADTSMRESWRGNTQVRTIWHDGYRSTLLKFSLDTVTMSELSIEAQQTEMAKHSTRRKLMIAGNCIILGHLSGIQC